MFFTEKRYRSINIGYISNNISNTIPLRVCLISELRCLTRIFAVRRRVTTVQHCRAPHRLLSYFFTKRDTKLVNDTQQSIVVFLEPLLVAPCTACRISLLPRPFELSANQLTLPDWAQFIINVLKCSNNPTVQASQTATKLIVTILTDINACNNNISNNNKREGRITSCLGG